jgi:hypothetical protein
MKAAINPNSWLLARGRNTRLLKMLALLAALALVGCDRSSMMKRMIPDQDVTVAKHYMEAIRLGDFDAVEKDAGPGLAGPELPDMLAKMKAIFPSNSEEPRSIKPVAIGFIRKGDSPINTGITLEYEFSNEWVLAEVVTQKAEGGTTINGVNVRRLPESIENLNRFTLMGKGESQYEVLLLAIASPLLALYACVICIKTRLGMSKWIWLTITLVGVGKLTVNWTTGQVSFTPFAVQFIPGGIYALGYSPWMIFASLPAGAIVFLIYRKLKILPLKNQPEGPKFEPTGEP